MTGAVHGWIYHSTGKATVALCVRDGKIAACPPYARRWAYGRDARELWTAEYRKGVRLAWFADDIVVPVTA